jgi:hypothetical protein
MEDHAMTDQEAFEVWRKMIRANETLADFNKYVVPAMKTHGDEFKLIAAAEAKRRGYVADKLAGVYVEPVKMFLTKGRVIIKVGWVNGVLHVEYASGSKVYPYPNVPEAWFDNLRKVPYPDHLWAGYKKKLEAAEKAETQPTLT